MQSLYTSPLRSHLRSLGIIKLLQLPSRIRGNRRAAKWKRHVGDTVTVKVAGISIQCGVCNEFEFCRALSLKDDEHILRALVSRCPKGSVYWDIGANLGHYAAILSSVVSPEGWVYAFEPEPRVRKRLSENLSLNCLKNVTIVPLGLSDHCGTETFYVAKDCVSGTHSLITQEPDGDRIIIELISGDDYIRAGNPRPNIIKIDVEGAELSVIQGMTETLRAPTLTAVICEIHFRILEESGQGKAPLLIKRQLHNAGLTDQVWLDPSHLMACRPNVG